MSRASKAVTALETLAEDRIRDGLTRYGIVTADRVIGVPMAGEQKVGKQFGRDRALATALWKLPVYTARLLVAHVAKPKRLTPHEMDAGARCFDNLPTCDTLCWALFGKSLHAFAIIDKWADDPAEFVRRASYALLAGVALHDKQAPDASFLKRLPLIEAVATDERNFVKKGVSWALRSIGRRKSPELHAAAREMADRLAASSDTTRRWIGRDAHKQFA